MTSRPVRKAVLPVAGLGTRFLPATKAVPKEMMPVVDRPAIQYIVEECARAGIEDVLLVTGWGKQSLVDHFDRRVELEEALRGVASKEHLLAEVERLDDLAQVHAVRQPEPLGLGHAVLQGRSHVGGDPFVVVLGDDLIDPDEAFLQRMIEVYEASGRPVVSVLEVPWEDVSKYGIATASETDEDGVFAITDLVEKPDRGDAPSRLAVIGRYVLPPEIFDVLADTAPGAGGEIQLTDALTTMAQEEPIRGVRFEGARHDVGDKLGFLKASVWMGARRDDLGGPFLDWLEGFVEEHRGDGS